MVDDPCANRTLSDEGVAAARRWNMPRQFQHPVSTVRSPELEPHQSADTQQTASGNPDLKPSQGEDLDGFQTLAVGGLPTGSYPARNLFPSRGGRSGVWGLGAGPCRPKRRQKMCANFRTRECRAHPSSSNPCTSGRSIAASCQATFGIRGRVCPPFCDRALKGCCHPCLLLGF